MWPCKRRNFFPEFPSLAQFVILHGTETS